MSPAISTHAPRTGSDQSLQAHYRIQHISTHAPRTGSDGGVPERHRATLNFNPRSPHGERLYMIPGSSSSESFQPTLPARGATRTATHKRRRERFQPTLPARRATRTSRKAENGHEISTHAPRTGSDYICPRLSTGQAHFNPRSPHGERPPLNSQPQIVMDISTHAPRTGSDVVPLSVSQ